MVSATAMDAGDPAMCGRFVITRWNCEIDSVESRAVYFASASRSCTMARLENPNRASGPAAFTASVSVVQTMAQGRRDARIVFDDRTNRR